MAVARRLANEAPAKEERVKEPETAFMDHSRREEERCGVLGDGTPFAI